MTHLPSLRHAVALLWLLAALLPARAAPGPVPADYTHTAWGSLQGAPVDVLKFAQGPDGWLWIATATGLYRYDGVRFERSDSVHGHRLYSSNVLGLLAARDGALWVGYRLGGVTALRPDGARTYMEADGLPGGAVFHIAEAPDGTVWVAARDGVAALRPGASRFEPQGESVGLPARRMFQILFARDGTQWVAALGGAFFRPPGAARFTQAWPRTTLMAMAEGPDGAIWASDDQSRYYRLHTSAPAQAPRPEYTASGMHFDRAGQMWLLHPDAVERAGAPAAQRLTLQSGLSGALPQTFFQDREGSIWIGTSAGLDRLRPNRLRALATPRHFDHPGMIAGPDGSVWIGDYAGHVASYTADGTGKPVLRSGFAAAHRAPDGTYWIGDDQSLHRRMADGTWQTVASPAGLRGLDPQALLQADDGALWASFSGGGLFRLKDGTWTRDGGLAGFPAALALTMARAADGTVWMGHARNQVSLVGRDERVRRLDARQGLQLGTVLALTPDGGTMWAGGEAGTALYRDGRFLALHGSGGETFRGVSGIVRLPGGDLWLHGADGIYRIGAAALAGWLRDPAQAVAFERFGALDGLRGHASQLRPLPSLVQAPDGQLWFATGSAIALLDPARIPRNPLPPPVLIRALTAGDRHYPVAGGAVTLPQGSDTLQIGFTALSLAMPERVRLRYRLEGVDHGWQEAVGRREAFYTNLAPGTYRFRVTAANEDGLWNEAGATLDVQIPPTFVQTPWFVVLLTLGGAALLFAAYTLRMRHVTRRLAERMQERMHERLAERSRIARSLHDTLLQAVQGLIMSFHAHVRQLPAGTRERERLDLALDRADRLLVEGRDQIMDLRASAPPPDLAEALREFAAGLAEPAAQAFEMTVTGLRQPLRPQVSEELQAIAREALCNAGRYAQAERIVLEVDYGSAAFTLRVHDDGCGLDAAVAQAGGRPGHWGLVGMRERAAAIGATLRMASGPGQGTALEVTLPAARAYGVAEQRGDAESATESEPADSWYRGQQR
ncbi:triple tyrosine motif-containing protein [[Empedobacter] haloabium]|uniref:Triple tyrosine motif-containing protein n=1 Tax=[Empedobacter] haloabium TaxID=592317 RepID=A0ABZ1UEE6_9BURK